MIKSNTVDQTPGPEPADQDHRWRFLLSGLAGTSSTTGADSADGRHCTVLPWTGLPGNARAMFSGSKAILPLSAVAGTLLIVESGLDTQVHIFFVRNTFFESSSHWAVHWGTLFPVILGGGVFHGWPSGHMTANTAAVTIFVQRLAPGFFRFLLRSRPRARASPGQ